MKEPCIEEKLAALNNVVNDSDSIILTLMKSSSLMLAVFILLILTSLLQPLARLTITFWRG